MEGYTGPSWKRNWRSAEDEEEIFGEAMEEDDGGPVLPPNCVVITPYSRYESSLDHGFQ